MVNDYGKYTKLITLPLGTKFWVRNGEWAGSIVEEDGVKMLYVHDTDRLFKISDSDELAIDILNGEGEEDDL